MITHSNIKIEYKSIDVVLSEIMWISSLLHEFHLYSTNPIIYSDNLDVVLHSTNPIMHFHTKKTLN